MSPWNKLDVLYHVDLRPAPALLEFLQIGFFRLTETYRHRELLQMKKRLLIRAKIRAIQRLVHRAVDIALRAFWIVFCTVILLGLIGFGGEWIWKRYFPKDYYERHKHQRVVHMERQPDDCEFWTSSIGNKNCHYERHDTVVNSSGDVVITWERVDDWK